MYSEIQRPAALCMGVLVLENYAFGLLWFKVLFPMAPNPFSKTTEDWKRARN